MQRQTERWAEKARKFGGKKTNCLIKDYQLYPSLRDGPSKETMTNWDSSLLLQSHHWGHLYPSLHLSLHTGPTAIMSAIKMPSDFSKSKFSAQLKFLENNSNNSDNNHAQQDQQMTVGSGEIQT